MTPSSPADDLLERARGRDPSLAELEPDALASAIRSLLAAGQAGGAIELLGRLGRRFSATDHLEEGAAVAREALESRDAGDVGIWGCRVLCLDGLYAFRQGDRERSLARNAEALAHARAAGDVLGECEAITGLARVALRDGDYRQVVEMTTEARRAAAAAADERAGSAPLHLLAAGTRLLGRYRAARALYLESLELNRRLGNAAWVSMEQHNLGWVDLHLGDDVAAAAWFEAGGRGTSASGAAWSELEQAGLDLVRGDPAGARVRFEWAMKSLSDLGVVPDPDDQAELDWLARSLAP